MRKVYIFLLVVFAGFLCFYTISVSKRMDVKFQYETNISEKVIRNVCFTKGSCLYETKKFYYIHFPKPELKDNITVEHVIYSGDIVILQYRPIRSHEIVPEYIKFEKDSRKVNNIYLLNNE